MAELSVVWRRLAKLLGLWGAIALLLTGCVDYAVGIRFDSQTHGRLTQTLHLSDRFFSLNRDAAEQWLQQFETKARALSGRVARLDAETLQVTLPFYNGANLVDTFNSLFGDSETSLLRDLPGAPAIDSQLSLTQQNRVLALRNHLTYELDLRALTRFASEGPIGTLRWLTLEFRLQTPWGVTLADTSLKPSRKGPETVWSLQPGSLNRIEVSFWIPSPIGIGAGVIGLLVGVGYGIKYKAMGGER